MSYLRCWWKIRHFNNSGAGEKFVISASEMLVKNSSSQYRRCWWKIQKPTAAHIGGPTVINLCTKKTTASKSLNKERRVWPEACRSFVGWGRTPPLAHRSGCPPNIQFNSLSGFIFQKKSHTCGSKSLHLKIPQEKLLQFCFFRLSSWGGQQLEGLAII
jgi:hypothetical protein